MYQLTRRKCSKKRKGVMLVFVCIMIFIFLIMSAIAVNIAYMQMIRTELRTATDATVSATAESLSRTQDEKKARAAGKAIALANMVGGAPCVLSDSDIVFGNSLKSTTTGKFSFTPNLKPYNSVQVSISKAGNSASGPANLFFSNLVGGSQFGPTQSAIASFLDRDIVLVLDRSGSMLIDNRLRDLQAAVKDFTTILKASPAQEYVGMASYSSAATQDYAMTTDLKKIEDAANDMVASGATNISSGISEGWNILINGNRPFSDQAMIVMTDGWHNTGIEPRLVAQDAANSGIIIYSITFGPNPDAARMQEIADIGHGSYYHASNGNQLREIFKQIATSMCTTLTQ
jgi:Ca-activated chloride channel homolog